MSKRPYDINAETIGWKTTTDSAKKRLDELISLSQLGWIDIVGIYEHPVEQPMTNYRGEGAARFWEDGWEMQAHVRSTEQGGVLRLVKDRMATDVEYRIRK